MGKGQIEKRKLTHVDEPYMYVNNKLSATVISPILQHDNKLNWDFLYIITPTDFPCHCRWTGQLHESK